jgi:hypothetical protein
MPLIKARAPWSAATVKKSIKSLLILFSASLAIATLAQAEEPSAGYEIKSVTRGEDQTIEIKGIVTNTGDIPIKFLTVCAEGYNSSRQVVDQSLDIPVSTMALKPAETAKWSLSLHDKDGDEITSYDLKLGDIQS